MFLIKKFVLQTGCTFCRYTNIYGILNYGIDVKHQTDLSDIAPTRMPIGIRHGSLLQYSTTVYTIDLKTYYSKMLLKAREKKKKQYTGNL